MGWQVEVPIYISQVEFQCFERVFSALSRIPSSFPSSETNWPEKPQPGVARWSWAERTLSVVISTEGAWFPCGISYGQISLAPGKQKPGPDGFLLMLGLSISSPPSAGWGLYSTFQTMAGAILLPLLQLSAPSSLTNSQAQHPCSRWAGRP